MKKIIYPISRMYMYIKSDMQNSGREREGGLNLEEQMQNKVGNIALHPNKYWASPLFFTIQSALQN